MTLHAFKMSYDKLSRGIISRLTLFFQFIRDRKFAKAERIRRAITKILPSGEFYKGFAMALNGIVVATEDKDAEAYVNNIDVKNINRDIQSFNWRIQKPLAADYDRGFFTAIVHFLKFIRKTERKKKLKQKKRS